MKWRRRRRRRRWEEVYRKCSQNISLDIDIVQLAIVGILQITC